MSLRIKFAAWFLAFGLLPAGLLFAVFAANQHHYREAQVEPLRDGAAVINDIIDRNLFERYGDVQAFGLNAAVRDPANWRNPSPDNPLVDAMNQYVTGYGVYRLMLVVGLDGDVLAANTIDATGKALATAPLYGRSFSSESWFRKVLSGDFLKGQGGVTGTVVEPAVRAPLVAGLYGDEGLVMTFAAPVRDRAGKVIAVWVNFADVTLVEDVIGGAYHGFSDHGVGGVEITLLDASGDVLKHFGPDGRVGARPQGSAANATRNLVNEGIEAAQAAVKGESGVTTARHAQNGALYVTGYAQSKGALGFPGLGWSVLVAAPADQLYGNIDFVRNILAICLLIGGALTAGAGFFAGGLVAKPCRALGDAMHALMEGKLEVSIPGAARRDELGLMAQAVEVFKSNAAEVNALNEAQRREQAIREARTRALEKLISGFEGVAGKVVDAVSGAAEELQGAAKSMAAAMEETGERSAAVAAASDTASTNVQTVAAAAEELTTSVAEIGRQVRTSAEKSHEAVEAAERTDDTVQGLADASRKIGDVVRMISDIAGQTNLLALNATIEAARAGDAGKGFAVVASEVKSLANQTAKATEDISQQIKTMQDATGEAVTAIERIRTVIGEFSEIATAIAGAVNEQAAATSEISRNVQEAAVGTREVSSNIAGVSEAAEGTAQSVAAVLDSAQVLGRESAGLRQEVEKFLAGVRAA